MYMGVCLCVDDMGVCAFDIASHLSVHECGERLQSPFSTAAALSSEAKAAT